LEVMSTSILNRGVTSRRRWTGARGLQNRIPMARKWPNYPGNLGKNARKLPGICQQT